MPPQKRSPSSGSCPRLPLPGVRSGLLGGATARTSRERRLCLADMSVVIKFEFGCPLLWLDSCRPAPNDVGELRRAGTPLVARVAAPETMDRPARCALDA